MVRALALALVAPGRLPAQEPVPVATDVWVLKLGDHEAGSSPALAPDGTIYQATYEGTLLAISSRGEIQWTFDTRTETEIKSSPAIADDGTIYFGSRDRKFYAVSPQGKLKWTFATGAWVDSSPALAADGTIYFGSWDKNFYALDPDGRQKWKFPLGAIIVSSPAIGADGTIYFGAMDKKLHALSPAGAEKWTLATSGEITSSPAIGPDGAIYIPSTDGNVYVVNPDGTERWHFHTGGYTESSPVLDDAGNIFVAGREEYVISPDRKRLPGSGLASPVDVTAVIVTGRAYWSRPWRSLQAFRADDHVNGQVCWQANTEENLSASPVVGPDGIVYAMAGRFFHAIRPVGDPLPPAKSSWPMFRANPRHTGRVGNSGAVN